MGKRVYETKNDVATMVRYRKHATAFKAGQKLTDESLTTNVGTCAALSASFLKNVIDGKKIELTNPDPVRAQIIFAKTWAKHCDATKQNINDVDAFNKAFIADYEMKTTGHASYANHAATFAHIKKTPGHYYIDIQQGHVVAAVNQGNKKWYFFDSNDEDTHKSGHGYGCWEFDTADDFAAGAAKQLKTFGWVETAAMGVYPCTK